MTTTTTSTQSTSLATAAPAQPWSLPAQAVTQALETTRDGLPASAAVARLAEHGPNVIPRGKGDTPLIILWRQINNPLLWVLIGSALLAIVFGKVLDGIVIAAAVILNAIVGFIQEYRANQAIEALGSMVPEFTTVIRDGTATSIPVADVVPGDIVRLQSGDQVPADMRLLSSRSLAIEEAALTGESVPVEKGADPVDAEAQIGDRLSMAFGGTLVTYGSGLGVVTATGADTELGRISAMLRSTTSTETPLTQQMKSFAGYLTIAIIILSVVLVIVGIIRGYMLGDAMVAGITLAVGAIPEGLPAIITIALAIGVQRMAKRRAVIRKLPAVETLGSTTVICSDKTGTLTRNEMTVTEIWAGGNVTRVSRIGYDPTGEFLRDGTAVEPDQHATDLLRAALLCNDSTLEQRDGAWRINGDPTEGALVVVAAKAGLTQTLRQEWTRHDAIPFESDRKYMATLHEVPGEDAQVIFMKGAPEVVLRASTSHSGTGEFTEDEVHARVEQLAADGLRVLAFASRRVDSDTLDEAQIQDMTFLGLVGIIDPPREEAIKSIARCHEAGIVVKMITGDHARTAEAIGRELGIVEEGHHPITGSQLAKMSDEELSEAVLQTNVFARVAPEHKLALVRALQRHGNVVAMTGDGVNDAPALRQANVGVAMGITGTAVSREAADLVLTDDNFATIAAAVEEGRRIYDNLVKAIAFVLPTNLGLALIMTIAVMFFPIVTVGGETVPILPISPIMMLWINLVASVTLAFPLAFEVPEKGIMERPPRDPKRPFIGRFILVRTVYMSIIMAGTGIVLALLEYLREGRFETAMTGSAAETQTVAVTGIVLFQIIFLLYSRSLRGTLLDMGVTSNPTIFIGIGAMLVLQLVFIYFPPANTLFGSAPLRPEDWAVLGVAFLALIPLVSLDRLFNKAPKAGT